MQERQEKIIGVDIGSCNSYFISKNKEGKIEDIKGGEDFEGIPTGVWYGWDGTTCIGNDYLQKCKHEADGEGRTFEKEKLICKTMQTDRDAKLLEDFLKLVQSCEMMGGMLKSLAKTSKVVVGYPNVSHMKNNTYQNLVKKALVRSWDIPEERIFFCPEAVAVAFSADELSRRRFGISQLKGNILVVDMGGTTVDFAVLTKKEENFFTVYEPMNSEIIPGKGITEFLYEQLEEEDKTPYFKNIYLENVKKDFFNKKDTPMESREVFVNGRISEEPYCLRYYATGAKKEIFIVSNKTDKSGEFSYSKYYGLSCQLANDLMQEVCKTVQEDFKIDSIVFAGGCSRMEPIRRGMQAMLEINGFLQKNAKIFYFDELAKAQTGNGEQPKITTANAVAYGSVLYGSGKYRFEWFPSDGDLTEAEIKEMQDAVGVIAPAYGGLVREEKRGTITSTKADKVYKKEFDYLNNELAKRGNGYRIVKVPKKQK